MWFPKKIANAITALTLVASVSMPVTSHAQAKSSANASTSRVFLLTATYGVVAGTLTGLGSLAFYDNPSSHSRNIAMGASLGLYVGLLMGAYMVYSVPSEEEKKAPGTPAKPGTSEDPLKLGSLSTPSAPLVPQWSPYVTYDEKQRVVLAGFHYQWQ